MISRLVLAGIVMLAIYLAIKFSNSKKRVETVEAGAFAGASGRVTDITYSTFDSVKDEEGNALLLKKYIPYRVENNCMQFVNIYCGDIVFAKKTSFTPTNVDIIKPFDIVLIEIDNKKKIRIVEKINTDNTLVTFSFVKDEVNDKWLKRYSTYPHRLDNILGIVSYKNRATNVS